MRSKILKILAVISFGLVTFPFVLTNDVLAFKNISVLRIFGYYAIFGAIFALGYIFGGAVIRRKKLLVLERLTGIFTFAAGLILLNFTDEVNIICAVGISSVLWYFLGERASRKHYADIFPAFMFGVYIGVTLLSYLFFGAMCERKVKEPVLNVVIIAFMVEICLAALLINQSGIYDKANRRRETRTMLPKGLSGYNAVLVLGFTVLGLALYAFADEIVWALNELIRLVIRAALFMLRGYSEFMATDASDTAISDGGYLEAEGNDLWNLLFIIILITVIIVFRKQILQAIKGLLKRICGFIFRETELSDDEPEFTDVFEEISASRRKNSERIAYSRLMRLYKNEADPMKKYRYGYSILLRQLKSCKADIRGADTVYDQHEKGKELCGALLKNVTDGYDKLRYNNQQVTAEQLSALDTLIKNLSNLTKGVL